MAKAKQVVSSITLLTIMIAVVVGAFIFAEQVLNNPDLQAIIVNLGYVGITIFATAAGLNVIVPIPAATFTPVFTAAGLLMPGIIIALTLGTLAADFIGYLFGTVSRDTVTAKYPRIVARLEDLYARRRTWLIPVIFLYAAFMPIPNEVLVIPLALLGVKWRIMVLPLLFGNLVNQTIYAYGFQNVFWYWF